MESPSSSTSTAAVTLGYMACSSLMLVVNKLAVHLLPAPSFVLLTQFFASWFVVKGLGLAGVIEVDALEWSKLRAFLPIAAAFLACVFANIKTLQYANVRPCRPRRNRGRVHAPAPDARARRWRPSSSSARRRRSPSPSPSGSSSAASCPTAARFAASSRSSPPPAGVRALAALGRGPPATADRLSRSDLPAQLHVL